jgi:hypothetical protein
MRKHGKRKSMMTAVKCTSDDLGLNYLSVLYWLPQDHKQITQNESFPSVYPQGFPEDQMKQ